MGKINDLGSSSSFSCCLAGSLSSSLKILLLSFPINTKNDGEKFAAGQLQSIVDLD